MKFDLSYWWPFARTVWGWTVASAAGLAALYYGPRKMLETFDWYMDRFLDYKVRDFLESLVTVSTVATPQGRAQRAEARSTSEIAVAVKMSQRRVRGCLKRLKRKNAVISAGQDRWRASVNPVVPN
jgi:hypothetical protein